LAISRSTKPDTALGWRGRGHALTLGFLRDPHVVMLSEIGCWS
jgi:hypothetical protein